MEYGLQLFCLRDLAEKDMDAALRTAAEQGYKWIEFAGFFGHTAEELRAMLDKYGLEVISAHCSIKDLIRDYEGTVKFHQTLGNKHFVICSNNTGKGTTFQERMDAFAEVCDPLIERLEKDGITLAFHNHSFNCLPRNDGTVDFEQMLWRTNIKFEVDVYWALVAKCDPVPFMERVKDRLVLIHMKDGTADGTGSYLGKGECPLKECWEKAKEWGIPMIVESEGQAPDGPTECKAGIDYLKSLEA